MSNDGIGTFTDLDGQLDGAQTLDLAHATLTRYVVFPSPEAADAATLYAAATHAMPQLEFAARLVIKSPAKRCGKSRLLDVLGSLVAAPLLTANISAAALVRSIGKDNPPTLLLDEADATFSKALKGDEKAEHLRGILNAGFGRDRPYIRWDITIRDTEPCETFAMAVLAGIGDLPDTIEDRAVIIVMRRKTSAEPVAKFRIRRDKPVVEEVRDKLGAWVRSVASQAGEAEPVMPAGLDDRAEDVWEALLAIADLAGGSWPARARKAAKALAAGRTADTTLGERLLADLRAVFGTEDAMHSESILDELRKISEAPWNDYFGRPLNARDLAKLLRPYGVRSVDVNTARVNKKGYRREHLHEPWHRYLPPARRGSATSATSATAQVSEPGEVADVAPSATSATHYDPVTRAVAEVAEVAEPPGAEASTAPLWEDEPAQSWPAGSIGTEPEPDDELPDW